MNIYICKVCGKDCKNLKGILFHLSRMHNFDDAKKEEYYNLYIKASTECKFDNCNSSVGYDAVKNKTGGYCCIQHAKSQKHINKGTANFECKICSSLFIRPESLSKHISDLHKETSSEEYYKKYVIKTDSPNGNCLQCGKQLKFISIAKGYQKFCRNTSCNVLWHNKNSDRLVQSSEGIKLARSSGDNIPTQLGYWLKKGFSEDDAKLKLADRQNTNSLEKFIERHGEEVGALKWRKRQLKWQETLNSKSDEEKDRISILKTSAIGIISKPERELNKILFNLGFDCKAQKCLHDKNDKRYIYDIVCKTFLIEFNGDYWHCNPMKYKSDFFNKSKKMTAQQIWDNDKTKIEVAELQGFKVLTIWESDWKINKQKCIDECMRFLNGNQS